MKNEDPAISCEIAKRKSTEWIQADQKIWGKLIWKDYKHWRKFYLWNIFHKSAKKWNKSRGRSQQEATENKLLTQRWMNAATKLVVKVDILNEDTERSIVWLPKNKIYPAKWIETLKKIFQIRSHRQLVVELALDWHFSIKIQNDKFFGHQREKTLQFSPKNGDV